MEDIEVKDENSVIKIKGEKIRGCVNTMKQ